MPVNLAAGPTNFNIGFFEIPKARVHTQVVAGKIAVTSPDLKDPTHSSGGHRNFGPNATTVALHALGPQNDPVLAVSPVIAPEGGDVIFVDDEDIDVAVIVKITKGGSSPDLVRQLTDPRDFGHVNKFLPLKIAQHVVRLGEGISRELLFQLLHGVSVGNKEIEPAVVIEIKELGPPAAVVECHHS